MPARIYDALLDGGHNVEIDRAFAATARQVFPGVNEACKADRSFMWRLVRRLVGPGIRPFLDIGSGRYPAQARPLRGQPGAADEQPTLDRRHQETSAIQRAAKGSR